MINNHNTKQLPNIVRFKGFRPRVGHNEGSIKKNKCLSFYFDTLSVSRDNGIPLHKQQAKSKVPTSYFKLHFALTTTHKNGFAIA